MCVGKADPDLAIHEKPMVEVDDALLYAVRTRVDPHILFPFLPCQTMDPQQIAVSCLHYMFFGGVTVQGAYFDKVGGIADGFMDRWPGKQVSRRMTWAPCARLGTRCVPCLCCAL